MERAHPVDESSDASSALISSDTVIKTLIFQKADVVMMTVMDVNLDYAIIGVLLFVVQLLLWSALADTVVFCLGFVYTMRSCWGHFYCMFCLRN